MTPARASVVVSTTGLSGCCGIYVTAFTARFTKRFPDLATEDAVLRADFTADRTVFFAEDDFLAGFFDVDRAGLRAMDRSSQWLLVESPSAQGTRSARAIETA